MKTGFFTLFSVLTLFFFTASGPRQVVIQGQVFDDATGDALIGANVLIKGTKTGAVTDVNGLFSIQSADSCVTLVVQYLGYETAETPNACAGRPVTVRMVAGAALDEVVLVHKPSPVVTREKRKEFKPADKSAKMDMGRSVMAMKQMSAPPPPPPAGNVASYFQPAQEQEAVNTESYGTITENRFMGVVEHPMSTFSIDVDAASYSNIRRFIAGGQLPPKDAVRIEEMINYFTYDDPEPQDGSAFKVATELSECPWQSGHQLLRVGIQGLRIPSGQLPPSNFVFLLDVSGSMSDYNKLPLLKESLKMLTDNLRPEDRVAIVVYAGAAGLVLPPTPGTDKAKIREALDGLQAGGSTAGGAGIQLAYKVARENLVKGGNNRVILATDGDFNVGISSESDLVHLIEKERQSGIFLSVLGFGMGNYQDSKMQELADRGNGNHAYIDNLAEARKVLVSEFGGTLFAIAKDVKLQIEFNPANVQGYRLIGYENRLLNREDFDDDTKDAGELGAGHHVTALYEIIPAGAKSPFLAAAPDLKYQAANPPVAGKAGDLCTVKLRYKDPDKSTSQLLEYTTPGTASRLSAASADLRWAASVAEFGMLLRDSEFKGNSSYESCKKMAEGALGKDPNGYRAEMVRLLTAANSISNSDSAEK